MNPIRLPIKRIAPNTISAIPAGTLTVRTQIPIPIAVNIIRKYAITRVYPICTIL